MDGHYFQRANRGFPSTDKWQVFAGGGNNTNQFWFRLNKRYTNESSQWWQEPCNSPVPAFWGNYTMRQKHQGRNAVTNSSLHQMDVLCPTEKTSRRKKQKQKLNKTKQANKHLVIFLRHRVISNIFKQEHSPTFFNGVSFVSFSLTMEDSINTMRHWLINVCSLLHCSSLHIFMMTSKNKMNDICIFSKSVNILKVLP